MVGAPQRQGEGLPEASLRDPVAAKRTGDDPVDELTEVHDKVTVAITSYVNSVSY